RQLRRTAGRAVDEEVARGKTRRGQTTLAEPGQVPAARADGFGRRERALLEGERGPAGAGPVQVGDDRVVEAPALVADRLHHELVSTRACKRLGEVARLEDRGGAPARPVAAVEAGRRREDTRRPPERDVPAVRADGDVVLVVLIERTARREPARRGLADP